MTLTMDIPDALVRGLSDHELGARAFELLAVDAYLAGEISRGKLGELLGKNFQEMEEYAKKHQISQDIDADDLLGDVARMDAFLRN